MGQTNTKKGSHMNKTKPFGTRGAGQTCEKSNMQGRDLRGESCPDPLCGGWMEEDKDGVLSCDTCITEVIM